MKRIWLQVAEAGGARFYSLAMVMFSIFLTARILGPAGQGMVAAALAWVSLFATFAGLSLGQVTQFRAQQRMGEAWLPEALGGLLILGGVLTLIAWMAAGGVFAVSNGLAFRGIPRSVLALAFVMLPFLLWEDFGNNMLTAVGRLRSYNLAQVMGRTLTLVGTLLLVVWLRTGIWGALIAQLAGQVAVALFGMAVLRQVSSGIVRVSRKELVLVLKGAAKLHLNTVGAFLLAQTSILMLNQFRTKAEVGQYQLAYQLMVALVIVPQAASMVFFSRMAKLGPDRLWPEQKRMGVQVLILMLVFGVIAYFLAPWIIPMLAGSDYKPSVRIFHLLLPSVLGMSLAQLMAPQWIGRGAFLATTTVTIATALANVIANALLIPRYGLIGAVWANWVCYLGGAVVFQVGFGCWCERRYRQYLTHSVTGT